MFSTPRMDGYSAAHLAAHLGNAQMIAEMAKSLHPERIFSTPGPSGNTPAHLAIYRGHADVIAEMAKLDNADMIFNTPNEQGLTPVQLAAALGRADIVAKIEESRSSVQQTQPGTTESFADCMRLLKEVKPFKIPSKQGDPEMDKFLNEKN